MGKGSNRQEVRSFFLFPFPAALTLLGCKGRAMQGTTEELMGILTQVVIFFIKTKGFGVLKS